MHVQNENSTCGSNHTDHVSVRSDHQASTSASSSNTANASTQIAQLLPAKVRLISMIDKLDDMINLFASPKTYQKASSIQNYEAESGRDVTVPTENHSTAKCAGDATTTTNVRTAQSIDRDFGQLRTVPSEIRFIKEF